MPYDRKSVKPAKPRKPILSTTSRPARVAKGKGRTIIRTATVPKPRAPRASATVHTESASGGESSDVDESPNDRGTLMEDIQEMIQSSIADALTVRDGTSDTTFETT